MCLFIRLKPIKSLIQFMGICEVAYIYIYIGMAIILVWCGLYSWYVNLFFRMTAPTSCSWALPLNSRSMACSKWWRSTTGTVLQWWLASTLVMRPLWTIFAPSQTPPTFCGSYRTYWLLTCQLMARMTCVHGVCYSRSMLRYCWSTVHLKRLSISSAWPERWAWLDLVIFGSSPAWQWATPTCHHLKASLLA